ncbi:MAG: hypothetical protein ABI175_12755 [Polyangiales bacterium]
MSSRRTAPRRATLASSFVLTSSALVFACTGDPNAKAPNEHHNPPMEVHSNPPMPHPEAPTASTDPSLKPAPKSGGTVSKNPDGTCSWMEDIKCPPPEVATCNPPPPMPVQCP